ncbi:glutamine-hydrolyzing GMP synthase [Methanopyrus sp. KOL6]|uniref:glutamine-hydrolyzing GMP synthase n=1 Tax=Methanopyrus sp. KOL6 TaxID=1937004 RepID=UPI000B4C02DF|nr:glutamine-hydrolyzing GMP synthase [Methanopyrus sp. KOL6]
MFDPEKFVEEAVEELRQEIGDRKAIIAVSGGVDSTTAAVLTHRAIGSHLVCVFVDHGFMRKGEPKRIRELLEEELGLNLKFVEAADEFFEALRGVTDPEKKRKIIGEKFIEIFERIAKEEEAEVLVQGTIAPDIIESERGIKSHHNVGGLPEKLNLDVVEPLRDLYKDEVRKVARYLGIPDEIVERMPFPGPGLAVRVLGEVTPEKVKIVREANAIVEEEIEKAVEEGKMSKPWQAFAALLDCKATGVKGDERDYGWVIAVRIVESIDAMIADVPEVPWEVLRNIQDRITSEVPEVTRVLFDVTPKPPATIEFE